jgi:hypothetical protein
MARSMSVLVAKDPDDYGPNWWRAAARRQAAQRGEIAEQDRRLVQMKHDQEERQNRELREQWPARHHGVK